MLGQTMGPQWWALVHGLVKSSTCLSRHSPHIVFNLILHMVSFQSESKALMLTNHNRSPLIRLATKDGCRRHSASPSLKSHLICIQNTCWRWGHILKPLFCVVLIEKKVCIIMSSIMWDEVSAIQEQLSKSFLLLLAIHTPAFSW